MRKYTTAFSLIELMVVIAIIAVLAAIAVPSYSQYLIKSKVNQAVVLVDGLLTDIKSTYSTSGSFPASITINGVDVLSGAFYVAVNSVDISSAAYGASTDGLGALLQVTVTGLDGIPGYIPANIGPQNADTLNYAMRDVNGVLEVTCGYYAAYASQTIPPPYLPANCTCADVSSYFESGTGC